VEKLRKILLSGSAQMNIHLSVKESDAMLAYIALLNKWNQAYNLTAVRDPLQMVYRHLLDSLSVLPYLHGSYILDVGSGPGLPGIPLAIMMPESQFVLLDSNGKKTRFMTYVIRQLKISNVLVEQCRAEAWSASKKFNIVTSRALSSLSEMVSMTEQLLCDNGIWIAMKGAYPKEEITLLQKKRPDVIIKKAEPLSVAGCEGKRHVIILARSLVKG